VLSIFTYSYDNVGNRTAVAEASGDLVTWSYDESYHLTREQRDGDNAYDTTFTYDGVGNRLTQISSGAVTTYVYDAANELSTSEDSTGVTTFSYDANGNTTGEARPNGDLVTHTWDIENHQTKVELPSSVINTITLDGDGKRRSIEDSSGLRKIVWDLENILVETDNSNATVAQYNLAPEAYGNLVSQRRSGATSFHHFDALGSTNKLTDSSINTLAEYLYRAFGQQTILSGSSSNPFTWVGNQGYYRQNNPQNYWIRARISDPNTGRWTSRDPLCESTMRLAKHNCYIYSAGKPTVAVDPSGLECPDDCIWMPPWVPDKSCVNMPAIRTTYSQSQANWCWREEELREQIHWYQCIAKKMCEDIWSNTCQSDFGDWDKQFRGAGTAAQTYCCESSCFLRGRCKGFIDYPLDLDNSPWCFRICTQRHEEEHVADCQKSESQTCRTTECRAYTKTWECLQRFLPRRR
jgi:RHS repeat-associated protein